MTKPVPDGYHTATPFLVLRGASEAIEFYVQAFGAEEIFRMPGAAGKVLHAEIAIGTSRLMVADETRGQAVQSPSSAGTTTSMIHLYVEDADEVYAKAVTAGAKVIQPLEDQYWGDRHGIIEDPFGHRWSIATRQEDLTPEQVLERAPTLEQGGLRARTT